MPGFADQFLGRGVKFFVAEVAAVLDVQFETVNRAKATLECGRRMVARYRRERSQCGVKGESKGSGTAFDWAVLSRFIGVRFDSGAPHAPSPLRGTSRSLLSKTATSLRCFSARARHHSSFVRSPVPHIRPVNRLFDKTRANGIYADVICLFRGTFYTPQPVIEKSILPDD